LKALLKTGLGPGAIELVDIPVPEPGYGQVRIKVTAAGICSSDIAIYRSSLHNKRLRPPVVLGHEGSGIVDAVGPGVQALKPGMPVVSETTYYHCGMCTNCRLGRYNLCPDRQGHGSSANGFFAPYAVVRQESVHVLPDNFDLEAAVLMEPLACAVHAVIEQVSMQPGWRVVVFGPGPLGLLVSQLVLLSGAQVALVGTTHSAPRLKLGRELGVNLTIDSKKEDVSERLAVFTENRGADLALTCVNAAAVIPLALNSLRKRGTLILGSSLHESVEMSLNKIFFEEIKLTGSSSSKPSSWEKAIIIAADGRLKLKPLITHRFSLEDWPKAYAMVEASEGSKILLLPGN
jgi:L-iditol 2-dehydrogenase